MFTPFFDRLLAAAVLTAVGTCALAAAMDTRLADAAKNGDVAAVKLLLSQKVDVNAPAADSSTALHWAVERNNLEMVNLLLASGAKVDLATRYNVTPLALASSNGNAAIL